MQAKHARDLVEAAVPAERGDAPEEFLCPISCDVMDDPVVAADNRTYEHNTIQRWIDQKTKELAEVQDLMCHAHVLHVRAEACDRCQIATHSGTAFIYACAPRRNPAAQ